MSNEVEKMSDTEVLAGAKNAVTAEKNATSTVITYLQEIYNRRLYLPTYSSIFEMMQKEYGYCEPSASLRMNAIRLINDIPDVKAKLEAGELSLTVAANIQTFLYSQKKQSRAYSPSAKVKLIQSCAGKSVRAVQKEFARRDPELEKRDIVRHTGEDRLRISYASSAKLEANFERIKMIWSHIDPNMSREDLLLRASEIVLDKIDPVRKAERAANRDSKSQRAPVDQNENENESKNENESENRLHAHEVTPTLSCEYEVQSRTIPAAESHKVFMNYDGGGCEFVDSKSAQRCGSHFQLQRDHIKPYSCGGKNQSKNLRVYCGAHNRWSWRNRTASHVKNACRKYG